MGARYDRKVTPGITESSRPRAHAKIWGKDKKIREIEQSELSLDSFCQIFLKNLEYIDGGACYIDVGSSYPGRAEAAKGGGVHPLKGIVSWVQNAVRQFV